MPRWLFGLFKAFNHLRLKIRTILDKRTVCMIFMSCSNNAVKPFLKSSYVWWHDNTFIPFKMSLQTMQFWVERDVFPRLACYINIKIVRASWNIKRKIYWEGNFVKTSWYSFYVILLGKHGHAITLQKILFIRQKSTLIMEHNNLWVSEKHPKYFIFSLNVN